MLTRLPWNRGDTDREAVTDARSEALVAFLIGPRPKNTAEAYQVIFAALQAVRSAE
jgi:hypothetical protein